VTLRSLLGSTLEPSLTKRVALAHAIAESLTYLHSVNWLHKGIRSSNILFHNSPLQQRTKQAPAELLPTLSGFDYARPDLPDTMTERSLRNLEHDLYRHPELIGLTASRSQKSHDIYSLGIVLIEIAYWQPIETVLKIDLEQSGATRRVRDIRKQLLREESEYLTKIDSLMGEIFRHVIQKCLVGGLEIGIPPNGDETDPKVGVEMQRVFLEEIVGNLGGVRV
jgi:serine/threonine protein kinase